MTEDTETEITLYKLPGDIYDTIEHFMSNNDLFRFLTLSRHISVSQYLLCRRQQKKWKEWKGFYLWELSSKGDLYGVKYLHSIGKTFNTEAMDHAVCKGHLDVVKFLHSVGAPFSHRGIDLAVKYGHVKVVTFLQSVGVPCTESMISIAAFNSHRFDQH